GKHASSVSGAIWNLGTTVTVVDSTISGNSADQNSGAILNEGGTLTMVNSTVSGNSCNGNGAGVYNYLNGTTTLTNVTITNNHSDNNNDASGDGGGLRVDNGTVKLKNTIVADNCKGSGTLGRDDVFGALDASSSYNSISDGPGM